MLIRNNLYYLWERLNLIFKFILLLATSSLFISCAVKLPKSDFTTKEELEENHRIIGNYINFMTGAGTYLPLSIFNYAAEKLDKNVNAEKCKSILLDQKCCRTPASLNFSVMSHNSLNNSCEPEK